MRWAILLITLCGCDVVADSPEPRQAPIAVDETPGLRAPPERCLPEIRLHLEQRPDGWHASIAVEQRDCDGWGAGWNTDGPDCEAVADALLDACAGL